MTNSRKLLIVVAILFLFGLVSKAVVEIGGLENSNAPTEITNENK